MKAQDSQPERREDPKLAVVLPCHSTRPSSTAGGSAFAQVDGHLLCLPTLGTVLRQSPAEAPVHPSDPVVASLPVQRRLAPGEVAELVAAYRRGVPVEDLAAAFRVHRTTVLGHVWRHGVPKRKRRALQGEDLGRAAQLYAEGRSADWVAVQFGVAASTVRRALKEAGVALRPGGRARVVSGQCSNGCLGKSGPASQAQTPIDERDGRSRRIRLRRWAISDLAHVVARRAHLGKKAGLALYGRARWISSARLVNRSPDDRAPISGLTL